MFLTTSGKGSATSTRTAGMSEAGHCSASCNWQEAGRFRFPLRQSMCASGLSETNRERKRRGLQRPLE